MAFPYVDREFYHGNQRLSIGHLTSANKVEKVVHGTGLVSVSAMEDQASTNNYPADDIPDHATVSGSSLLEGSMVFMQLDEGVRTDFFGQEKTTNGFGFASTGVFPKRIVQYVTLGTKRDGSPLAMVTVYPNMSVTGKPTKETETDSSDEPTAVQWTANVQASGSDFYLTPSGKKSAEFEYRFEGDNVAKVLEFIDGGGILLPTTTLAGSSSVSGDSHSKAE